VQRQASATEGDADERDAPQEIEARMRGIEASLPGR